MARLFAFPSFCISSALCAAGALLFLVFAAPVHAQTVHVSGRVVSEAGRPVPFANVQLAGTTSGAATDTNGRFLFATRATGTQTLRASAIGRAPAERQVLLRAGDTLAVRLVLRAETKALPEAVVEGQADRAGLAEASTLRPLEAVTTAGASGDLFRAVQMLPGVQAAHDGAGLFVRGGEKDEVAVFLDGARVTHPYKYESPSGGAFGTIPPFLVEGTHFSAGGFSARYGDALSGVLAMESAGHPGAAGGTAGLGLAAASLSAAVPVTKRLGVRASANRSFTELLFRANGQAGDFYVAPRSLDATLGLTYRYADAGRLKALAFVEKNRFGAHETADGYEGRFDGETANALYNLHARHAAGAWHLEGSFSLSQHAERQQFGALDLRTGDDAVRLRLDAGRALSERVRLTVGALAARRRATFRGTVPAEEKTFSLREKAAAGRAGAYAEAAARLTSRLGLRAGFRADHHTRTRQTTAAPRLQLRYRLSERTSARLVWGFYHQFPEPYQLNAESGNTSLRAARAQHFIAGLRHGRGAWLARLEAYYKPYARLVVEDPVRGFSNAGGGESYGLDAFVRYGAFLQTRASGWAAYSFLRARRLQPRWLERERVLENGPAPQSLTHSLTLVGKVRLVGMLFGGGTARVATGKSVTPVLGAVLDEAGGYRPVEGPVGSERLPPFARLDLQLSYYWPFGSGRAATFYTSLANATDRANVVGYDYAADFSERSAVLTNYRRLFYAGVTVDF